MASMLRDVRSSGSSAINVDALKSEIRQVLINQKANACPIAMRMAWHSSGTYDKTDKTGGSNGGRIRFAPESTDPDNAGLSIIRDLLLPVKERHPEISHADLYTFAGCVAIEFLGGPVIPFNFGRTDDNDGRFLFIHLFFFFFKFFFTFIYLFVNELIFFELLFIKFMVTYKYIMPFEIKKNK